MTPKTGRVVIPGSQSESSVLELRSDTIVGLYMPASWNAANLGFSASHDGVNFSDVYDFGSPVTVQAAAGQYVPLEFSKFVGIAFLKIKSESGGAPVNQTAERVITPVFRVLE